MLSGPSESGACHPLPDLVLTLPVLPPGALLLCCALSRDSAAAARGSAKTQARQSEPLDGGRGNMSRLLAAFATCLALFPRDAMQSPASPLAPLQQRQEDGYVSLSAFVRRAYHRCKPRQPHPYLPATDYPNLQSTSTAEILDGWLYIDGGEFSYRSSTGLRYQYCASINSVLCLDQGTTFVGELAAF